MHSTFKKLVTIIIAVAAFMLPNNAKSIPIKYEWLITDEPWTANYVSLSPGEILGRARVSVYTNAFPFFVEVLNESFSTGVRFVPPAVGSNTIVSAVIEIRPVPQSPPPSIYPRTEAARRLMSGLKTLSVMDAASKKGVINWKKADELYADYVRQYSKQIEILNAEPHVDVEVHPTVPEVVPQVFGTFDDIFGQEAPLFVEEKSYDESWFDEGWYDAFYDNLNTNFLYCVLAREQRDLGANGTPFASEVLRGDSPPENFTPQGLDYSEYTHEFYYVAGTSEASNTWTLYYSTNLNNSWISNCTFKVNAGGIGYCMTIVSNVSNPLFFAAKRSTNVSPVFGFYSKSYATHTTNAIAHPFAWGNNNLYSVFDVFSTDEYPLIDGDSFWHLTNGSVRTLTVTNGLMNDDLDSRNASVGITDGYIFARRAATNVVANYWGIVPYNYTNYFPAYAASLVGNPVAKKQAFTEILSGFTPSEWSHAEKWSGNGWASSVYYYSGSWHGTFDVDAGECFSFYNAGAAKSYTKTWNPTIP